jgi:cytochrome c oxidase subunit II
VLPLVGCSLLLAGCGSKQNALAAHSKAAKTIASLWWNMLAGSVAGLALVAAILLASWLRRRRAVGNDRGALAAVIGLGIVIPICVLCALFVIGNVFVIRDVVLPNANATNHPALTIRVTGHQFWWEIHYPGTRVVTANEIHIPIDTNVRVLIHTRDVIHSFWVPQLNRKIDMLPDQVNQVLLYADKVGRYRGQCAEYCGLQHAHMGLYVFADPPGRYRAWLAEQAKPATGGDDPLFDSACGSCHTIRGTSADGNTGPDLTHVASRTSLAALTIPNTPARMHEWIKNPQRVKPGNEMPDLNLSDAEVSHLVAYLEAKR